MTKTVPPPERMTSSEWLTTLEKTKPFLFRNKSRPATPTIIHVNQLVIRSNAKRGENNPPLTVRKGRNGKNAKPAHEVIVHGPSKVIHSPHNPLKCGARVWIETNAEVELIGG